MKSEEFWNSYISSQQSLLSNEADSSSKSLITVPLVVSNKKEGAEFFSHQFDYRVAGFRLAGFGWSPQKNCSL
jgi:hypothetical protein